MAEITISERVTLSRSNKVAEVKLNRPDKLNALDYAMFSALVEAGEGILEDNSIRAVVLHGEGSGFCAGLDMSIFENTDLIRDLPQRTHGITNLFQQAAWIWHTLPVPVIAAVQGACVGGGLQVALGADMRIVHPEAKLSVMEINWGLVTDMCYTVLAPELMRADQMRELLYSGRVFSGTEALKLGLATQVTGDPLSKAREMARDIATKNPHAVHAAKRLLNRPRDDIAAALLAESVEMEALLNHPNQREAVRANLENRQPKFSDPA